MEKKLWVKRLIEAMVLKGYDITPLIGVTMNKINIDVVKSYLNYDEIEGWILSIKFYEANSGQ